MNTSRTNTLDSRQRQERVGIMLTCLLGGVLFYMSFLLTYHLVHDLDSSDFLGHLEWAKELSVRDAALCLLGGDNKLWHICVKALIRYGGMKDVYAVCLVTAVAAVAAYGVVCALLGKLLEQFNRALLPVAAFVQCLVGPVYLPWYNEQIYLGQSSPNVWHSPTQIMLRPFALATFWMTIVIYSRLRQGDWPQKVFQSRGEAALYTGLIVVSEWAKPSYFQGAVPALGILMVIDLIRSRGKAFPFCLKMAAAHIPAAAMTAIRFVEAFYIQEGSGGVEFAFLDVWKHYSDSILMSILLLLAFPIFVMVIDRRRFFSGVEGQFSLAMLLTSGLMKACLAEQGRRRYSGNFGWSWGITAFLVWFVALKEFLRLMTSDELPEREYKIAAYGGWTLLALHLLTGIVYFCLIVTGTKQC